MTPKETYEAARAEHQAAHRRVCEADGAGLPEKEIARLEHELADALAERNRAFELYMDSD